MKNEPIAILFDQLGPYAARLFRVVAIETCAIAREYQWERMDEPRAFDRVALFDDVTDGRGLKRAPLQQKMWRLSKSRLEERRGESRRIVEGFTPAQFAIGTERAIDAGRATPICRASLFSSLVVKALTYR